MDKESIVKKVHDYADVLASIYNIDEVILFGSYVRGNATEDSDIDVAVVMNQKDIDYFIVAPTLWKLRTNIDVRIEPMLFEKGIDPSGFLEFIKKEGLRIYPAV